MTDEELLRRAYIEREDPLVQELCSRIARLIDELQELKNYQPKVSTPRQH